MRLRLETLLLVLTLSVPLVAQEAEPTPRQAYQRTEALFAQGHVFTAEEVVALDDLRAKLVASGDDDLAASLDLLRWGSAAQTAAAEAKVAAAATLGPDTDLWVQREVARKDASFWRTVRDGGLIAFSASTASALLLAVTLDREEGYMKNGFFTDWSSKNSFNTGLKWALLGSAATSFLSLFPLLWGEARQ